MTDLFDISRITREKIDLHREPPVRLDELIKAAIESSRPLIDAQGHEAQCRAQGCARFHMSRVTECG